MEYIRICNWKTFQHYKKRNPPWIKLHTSLLDNEAFECLQDDSKLLLLCLWLFAARKGNGEIPADLSYLQRKLPISKRVKLQPLIDAGFIECYQNDSELQATDDSTMLSLAETETEAKAKTKQRQRESKPPKLAYGKEFQNIKLTEEEHCKLVAKFGESKCAALIDNLDRGIESKGYKYKSYYATILNWERKDERNSTTKRQSANSGQAQGGKKIEPGSHLDQLRQYQEKHTTIV